MPFPRLRLARRSLSSKHSPARWRPTLESLEERRLLAAINYVGFEASESWRSTDVVKSLDPDGDNILGEHGYVYFAVKDVGNANTGCPATADPVTYLNAGLNVRTRAALPQYLTVQTNGATNVCHFNHPPIDNPALQTGAAVADVHSGLAVRNIAKGTEGSMFNLVVGSDFPAGGVRIGVAAIASGGDSIAQVRVHQTTGGAVQATALRPVGPSGIISYYFDLTDAQPGDVFTVSALKLAADPGNANILITGFTFDPLESLETARLSYAGEEAPTASDWRSTSVPKSLDPNGNDILGEEGYVWYATKNPGVGVGCPAGDPLTFNTGTVVTRSALPSYLALSNNGQASVCHYDYTLIDSPLLAPAATVADVHSGLAVRGGVTNNQEQTLVNIDITAEFPAAGVRIMIAAPNAGADGMDRFWLRQTRGGGASALAVRTINTGGLSYYAFDLVGAQPGDRFVLSGLREVGNANILYAGILFDRLPNTPPAFAAKDQLETGEGGQTTFTPAHLSYVDPEEHPARVRYELTTLPQFGQVLLNGAPLGVGGEFTQFDIDSGRVTYQHGGADRVRDLFEYRVTDGDGHGPRVVQSDFSSAPANMQLIGVASVAGGILELTPDAAGVSGSAIITPLEPGHTITSFSASFDMLIGKDSLANGADGLSFIYGSFANVAFGEGGPPGFTDLRIEVDTHDNGGGDADNAIEVWYGGVMLARNTSFLLEDNQFHPMTIDVDAAGLLTLTYRNTPVFTGLAVPGYNPQPNWRFGLGGRTGGLSEKHWIDNLSIVDTSPHTFFILATPVDDHPMLAANTGLVALPEGATAVITPAHLAASDVNDPPTAITFTLATPPAVGQLLLNGSPLGAGGMFTQDDIDNSRLSYQHGGGDSDLSDSFTFAAVDPEGHHLTRVVVDTDFSATPANVILNRNNADSAIVTNGYLQLTPAIGARTGTAIFNKPLPNEVFHGLLARFELSIGEMSADGADGFSFVYSQLADGALFGENTTTPGLQVQFDTYDNGGGEAPAIDIVYNNAIVASAFVPAAVLETDSFVPVVIEVNPAGELTLLHNNVLYFDRLPIPGWNPQADWRFALGARTGGQFEHHRVDNLYISGESTAPQTFAIDVLPVDDSPHPPVNNGQTVLEGSTTAIAPAALSTTDANNPPAEVLYSVLATPVNGVLLNSGSPLAVGGGFTQDDIDAGRLEYAHDGSETLGDSFTFQVRDAQGHYPGVAVIDTDFSAAPAGAFINGTAAVQNGHLELTQAVGGQTGSAVFNKPNPTQQLIGVHAFFDLLIDNAGGAGADGFSFVYSQLADGALFGENGPPGTPGLVVSFDIYDNGGGEAPAFEIFYAGASVGVVHVPDAVLETGDFVPVAIVVDNQGRLTLRHNDVYIFRDLPLPGWNPGADWRFGVGARTGGVVARQYIDNLVITGETAEPHTFNFTVTPVNDPPVVTAPAAAATLEDQSVAIVGVSASDSDAGAAAVQATFSATAGTLSVRTDVPGGVTAGQVAANGTLNVVVTAPLAALNATLAASNALVYAPNAHVSGADVVTISVNDQGATGLGGPQIGSANVAIAIEPVADAPTLSAANVAGDEDTPIPLAIVAALVDTDGSETLTLEISGVPAGVTLAPGMLIAPGVYRFTAAEIASITATPPLHSDANFDLTAVAIATETGNGDTALSPPATFTVVVNAVADPPTIAVAPATGVENTPIPLVITPALVDTDGSEILLQVDLTGVPPGATLSAGVDNGGGHWTVPAAQLAGLTLLAHDGVNPPTPFDLAVTATSQEQSNGDTAVSLSATLTVTVQNAPPTAQIGGPTSSIPGFPVTFTLSAVDAPADMAAGFTYEIDWNGDGVVDEVIAPAVVGPTAVTHTFGQMGSFTIRVTATDKDGGQSAVATHTVDVVPVAQIGDIIFAGGQDGVDDRIVFYPAFDGGVLVRYNNIVFPASGSFQPTPNTRLVAFGRSGNDSITVSGNLPYPVEFDGGDGNDYLAGGPGDDTLWGGAGNDVILTGGGDNFADGGVGNDRIEGRDGDDTLFGGEGNDSLSGRGGNDVLVGGPGNDQLHGGDGDDLLVGGDGDDVLNGYTGDDVILGGFGDDRMFGDRGNDLLIGGAGLDRLRGDADNDELIGGMSAQEAAIDAALAALQTGDPTDFNALVLPAWNAWRTANDSSLFGGFLDDGLMNDLTGGLGADLFRPGANDFERDLRETLDGDQSLPL